MEVEVKQESKSEEDSDKGELDMDVDNNDDGCMGNGSGSSWETNKEVDEVELLFELLLLLFELDEFKSFLLGEFPIF